MNFDEKNTHNHQVIVSSPENFIFIAGTDGYFKYANSAFEKILGYTTDELLSKPLLDLIHPDDHTKTNEGLKKRSTGNQTFNFESRLLHKNGSVFYLLWPVTPLPRNEVIYGIGRNITKSKEVDNRLPGSKDKRRPLIDNIPVMAYRANPDWSVEVISNSEPICGYNPDEFLSENVSWFELIHPDDKSSVIKDASKLLEAPSELIQEYRIIARDGIVHFIRDHKKSFFKDDVFQGIDGVVIDISQQKQQSEDRKKNEARLKQAQKMEALGTLAGGIAHDFNNLLSIILGYGEMAKEDAPPGTAYQKDIEAILTGANRAKELVRQILDFSRKSELERTPVRIQPLIKEEIKMLRSSLPSTISMSENIGSGCEVILADPAEIHQIVMNLCTNALHAMEQTGGVISVASKPIFIEKIPQTSLFEVGSGEYIEFSVTDTGVGMGPDVIGKIFDPYFTTKRFGNGTGMGLSIIHGILRECGGTISVESRLGKGSTFRVHFPVVGTTDMQEIEEDKNIPSGNENILFIDDEKLISEVGTEMLQRLGYKVTAKRSSIEALKTFKNNPKKFDLVITDQTMPNLSGSDLSRQMIQIKPDIPIILCTGYSDSINEYQAKVIGVKEFALKPITRNEIAKLIRKVLDD